VHNKDVAEVTSLYLTTAERRKLCDYLQLANDYLMHLAAEHRKTYQNAQVIEVLSRDAMLALSLRKRFDTGE
jgi:hypothetical protein